MPSDPPLAPTPSADRFRVSEPAIETERASFADEVRGGAGGGEASAAERLFGALEGESVDSLCNRGWVEVDFGAADGADFDGMEALVIFDLPTDRVLQLLAQTERQREYRRDLRDVRSIEHSKHVTIDQHRMRVMFVPVEYRVRYQFDYEHDRMSWRLDPAFDGSLDELEGFWELHAFGEGRTLAHFGTSVRVSKALPRFIQDLATRKKLPRDLQDTREWVNASARGVVSAGRCGS